MTRWTKAHDAEYDRLMKNRFVKIARENVDNHIGDVVTEDMTADEVMTEVETLAIDALVDNDCPGNLIGIVTDEVASKFRQEG